MSVPWSRSRAVLVTAILVVALTAGSRPTAAVGGEPIEWKKPVYYSLGMMGVGLTLLVGSGQAADDPSYSNFRDAFRSGPKQDDDSGLYNFVLHPLWGSETYLRAREAHMGKLGSIAFSLGASITWEYFFESWTEHPSTQDLLYTTGLGWMLGELRYRLKQRADGKARWWIDPINTTLEHMRIGVERDGRDTAVSLSYAIHF
jgi:hypothetical protein